MRFFLRLLRLASAGSACAAMAGCAGFSSDGGLDAVSALTRERSGQQIDFLRPGTAGISAASQARSQALLAQPLTVDAAVELALRNNRQLLAGLAGLGVAEADLVQAGRLRNPGFTFGRLRGGGDGEIDRSVTFDVIGLLTMPARRGIEQGRFEQATLLTAAQAVQLAAETRRAYFIAVAAVQTASYMGQVDQAARAGAELGQRMAQVGNWSALAQAREQVFHAEATAQLARAQQGAVAAREQLTRLMGLWGEQIAFQLPERLPDLPAAPGEAGPLEAQAIANRLDVRISERAAAASAAALGLTEATGLINVLDLGYMNKSASATPRENGYQIALELPLFDWGRARNAKAQALYMQALQHTADVAVRARSEVRVAYAGYRSSYDLARHYRDQVVPLRQKIAGQVLLRYNGMLSSVFELLADARQQVLSVNGAIEAQRDFWLAETALQTAIHGAGNIAPTVPN